MLHKEWKGKTKLVKKKDEGWRTKKDTSDGTEIRQQSDSIRHIPLNDSRESGSSFESTIQRSIEFSSRSKVWNTTRLQGCSLEREIKFNSKSYAALRLR